MRETNSDGQKYMREREIELERDRDGASQLQQIAGNYFVLILTLFR